MCHQAVGALLRYVKHSTRGSNAPGHMCLFLHLHAHKLRLVRAFGVRLLRAHGLLIGFNGKRKRQAVAVVHRAVCGLLVTSGAAGAGKGSGGGNRSNNRTGNDARNGAGNAPELFG